MLKLAAPLPALAPALALALALAPSARAAPPPARDAYPRVLPSAGGEVVIPNAFFQRAYDDFHYAPARRAGDYVYISGVVVGPRAGEGHDAAAFKDQVRRAFRNIQAMLQAEGATFADVTMINSFHVWTGPNFAGGRDEQFEAFSAVKDEFMPPPHPAWTAVGTTGLLADNGVVEVQMIAYAPKTRPR